MINTNITAGAYEIAQLSYRMLMDDRQDYIIEALNTILKSKEKPIEDKVLALDKLGDIYYNFIGDTDKALEYINEASTLAEAEGTGFTYILGGDIWGKKLQYLEALGRCDEIGVELERIINKYLKKEFKCNSYLFNAYKYKAQMEYNCGNYKAALDYLTDAQEYYPVEFFINKLHVIESTDYKNDYENLRLLLSRNVCGISDWQI